MAVPFSNTKLRPPPGFRNVLEGLSREVLRCQPNDIYAFGTLYFDKLVDIRKVKGLDPVTIGRSIEDLIYNIKFKQPCSETSKEAAEAAVKIQTKYRQYRAKVFVHAMRRDQAALKIQAGFKGYLVRKKIRGVRMQMDEARCRAMTDEELEMAKEGDVPAMLATVDSVDTLHEDRQLDMSNPEVRDAAMRIHAGVQGMLHRQQMRGTIDEGQESSQLDMSNPEVREAAMRIHAGVQGMLHRQQMRGSIDETDDPAEDDQPDVTDSTTGLQ